MSRYDDLTPREALVMLTNAAMINATRSQKMPIKICEAIIKKGLENGSKETR